jgi:hypothetical protein
MHELDIERTDRDPIGLRRRARCRGHALRDSTASFAVEALMRLGLASLVTLLCGCAATTSIVLLDPAKHYPPSASVEILLKPPERPYVEIAKLESQGLIGEPEPALLENARAKAAEIGADALIVVETSSVYQLSVIVHEPWPPYLPWYQDRWHGYRYWYFPPPFAYSAEPLTLPGGNAYTVRSIAIKYR